MSTGRLVLRFSKGFNVTNRLAVFAAPAPLPEPPVKPATYSTSGSSLMMLTTVDSFSFMLWKETSCSAWIVPRKRPVSVSGKNPLGTTTKRQTLTTNVTAMVPNMKREWRRAHLSVTS